MVKLTHVYLDLYFLYNKAAASVSNVAWQTKPRCLRVSGAHRFGAFPWTKRMKDLVQNSASTKASTRGALR